MDREEVGPPAHFQHRIDELNPHLLRPARRDIGVVGEQPHAECVRPLRHQRAHLPQAYDAEGLPMELHALPPFPVPLPSHQSEMSGGDVPGLRQHQRQSVLGGGQNVALGRVDDQHAELRRGIDVHVVDADAGPSDHFQLFGSLQKVRGDLRAGADDHRVVVGDDLGHFAGTESQLHVDFHVLAELFETTVGKLLGNEDSHGRVMLLAHRPPQHLSLRT
jgi:hypothetical protein